MLFFVSKRTTEFFPCVALSPLKLTAIIIVVDEEKKLLEEKQRQLEAEQKSRDEFDVNAEANEDASDEESDDPETADEYASFS